MKTVFGKVAWMLGLLVLAVPLMAEPSMTAREFKAAQKAVAGKLSILRDRLDRAGAENLSLAFVLSVKSKDALAVSSTVLAYQEYAQKRSIGILMGAAIENASNLQAMQQVRDAEFKKLLASAAQEQFGVEQTFSTINELLDMDDASLGAVVGLAKRLNPQSRAQDEVKKAVKEAAQAKVPLKEK